MLSRGLAERLAMVVHDVVPDTLPVDLAAAARALGVAKIQEGEIVEDGRTEWVDDLPFITVRRDRPPQRKRFTLAHELGHVLLAQGAPRAVALRTRSLEPDEEEALCDQLAAAVLMPRLWIAESIGRDRLTLEVLRQISSRAGVSMTASALRIGEVRGRRCMLLRWHHTKEGWVLMAKAGVRRELLGTICLAPRSESVLDSTPLRRDVWRDLSLFAEGDRRFRRTAHVSRWERSAMTLFSEEPAGPGGSR